MNVHYTVDHNGLAALLVHDDMGEAMRTVGLAGLSMATAIAPDATPFGTGYKYRFGLDVDVETMPRGTPRQTATLYNDDPAAGWIETGHIAARRNGNYGTGRWVEGHHVLKRVRDALDQRR